MPLFDVAILERATKKEAEDGKGDRLVLAPTSVVAADEQSAAIAAALANKELGTIDLTRMEVLVRPFR